MPLLRVSNDVESFDTFDVAEMADSRNPSQHPPRSWFSRRGRNAQHCNDAGDADDLISIDSSKRSDTSSIASGNRRRYNDFSLPGLARAGSVGGGSRQSFASTGANSYISSASISSYGRQQINQTPPTHHSHNALLQSNHSGNNTHQNPYIKTQHQMYDEDNSDGRQCDPWAHQLEKNYSPNVWGNVQPAKGNIPEEDETTSASTTEDSSSIAPHQQNQNQNPLSHPPQQNKIERDSLSSSLTPNDAPNDNSTYITQLESRVAKLNFELATTKTSLDKLQLEHRHLHEAKDKLAQQVEILEEENERLHLRVERLQKERLMRNMEGTKGVICRTGKISPVLSCESGGASNGKDNDSQSAQKLQRSERGNLRNSAKGTLEVPFHSNNKDCTDSRNVGSFYGSAYPSVCEATPNVDDNEDTQSVALSLPGIDNGALFEKKQQQQQQQQQQQHKNQHQQQEEQEQEQEHHHHHQQQHCTSHDQNEEDYQERGNATMRAQGRGILSMIGGKKQPLGNEQKQFQSENNSKRSKDDLQLLPDEGVGQNLPNSRRFCDNDNASSNFNAGRASHCEEEIYGDDDPFATCYPSKEEQVKNHTHQNKWFQRYGRGGGTNNNNVNSSIEGSASPQRRSQDNLNSCRGDINKNNMHKEAQENFDCSDTYTSFDKTASINESDRSDASDMDLLNSGKKGGGGFNLFRGLRGQHGR